MDEKHAPTISQQNTQEMCLMALKTDANHLMGEGQSSVRPPLFVGDNYAYWKTRIRLFIQANDYEAWRVGDEKIVKDENEWDANELKMA